MAFSSFTVTADERTHSAQSGCILSGCGKEMSTLHIFQYPPCSTGIDEDTFRQ